MSEEVKNANKGLEALRAPFEKHHISLLPKPYKKDSQKGDCDVCGGYHGLPAAHLDYVGHAAVTHRFLEVDPHWNWEPLAKDPSGLPLFDKSGGLWIKLTICGVTRMGYGNAETSQYKEVGAREKEVIGDALRNAAMRFGVALDLWHKGDLFMNEEQQQQENKSNPPKQQEKPPANSRASVNYVTDARIKLLYAVTKEAKWTEKNLRDFVKHQWNRDSMKALLKTEYDILIAHLKAKPSPVAELSK